MLDELLQERVVSSRGRRVPRGVKQIKTRYGLRRADQSTTLRLDLEHCAQIVK